MRKLIMGAAVALPLAFAGTAEANTVSTGFDSFTIGSVNGQQGWQVTNPNVDQSITGVLSGDRAFRMSNAYQAGGFGDQPHSTPVIPAGETAANNVLVNEFTIKTAADAPQPGLSLSVSPDEGNGTRMSYLRFDDMGDGVHVFFNDTTADGNFISQDIATLRYAVAYAVKIETTFVKGDANDVVRIFIDDIEKVRGSSWENYYRFAQEREPGAVDRLLIRAGASPYGEVNPSLRGNGFIFDNVKSTSSHVNNPAPLNPPAPGPAGPQGSTGNTGATGSTGATGATGANGTDGKDGVNGTNGVNGKDGVTTIIRENGSVAGATIRTLHVRKVSGMKFISARASLDGKSVRTIRGRTIKVDLRGKSVGRYRVVITARYKAHGKVYKVRSTRNLRIVQK